MLHSEPRGSLCAVAFTVIEADIEAFSPGRVAAHGVRGGLAEGAWRWEPAAASAAAPAASVAAAAARRGLEQRQQLQSQPQYTHELVGLAPGAMYEVVVRDDATGEVSDPERMRTSAVGAMHVAAYRISEYTMDVDFLENHDAASLDAMPLQLRAAAKVQHHERLPRDRTSREGKSLRGA